MGPDSSTCIYTTLAVRALRYTDGRERRASHALSAPLSRPEHRSLAVPAAYAVRRLGLPSGTRPGAAILKRTPLIAHVRRPTPSRQLALIVSRRF